ncbi:hypothetical protein LCGC14_1870710 [marine sediment metagenome]|uniref:Uncharacterized protein n=1 Tax=marine sediment metagenome TaxID=412755 RepID=A0A0F9J3Y1_9ZZZZ
MKKNLTKKIFLIGFFSFTIFSAFLMHTTKAQTWTYNGVDTERIPYHSVYPSEWYVYNVSDDSQRFFIYEISNGNVTDLGLGNAYCVWLNRYWQNATSGELEYVDTVPINSWNDSIGYQGTGYLLPVEDDGKVSQRILENVSSYISNYGIRGWEFNETYLNPASITFWNETFNNRFWYINYTEKGIFASNRWDFIPVGNMTLISVPAQLPPEFSFSTEDSILDITSSNIKLKVNITDVDNNNNGVIDTDYQYRILINSAWTNWTTLPALIDYNLSSIPSGSHQITVEVKNMYGITQEQIIVQYTAPPPDNGISGYSTMLIAILLFFSASIILFRHRKKSKYHK